MSDDKPTTEEWALPDWWRYLNGHLRDYHRQAQNGAGMPKERVPYLREAYEGLETILREHAELKARVAQLEATTEPDSHLPMLFVGFHSDGVVETCGVQPHNPSDVAYVPLSEANDLRAKADVLGESRRQHKTRVAELERLAQVVTISWDDGDPMSRLDDLFDALRKALK